MNSEIPPCPPRNWNESVSFQRRTFFLNWRIRRRYIVAIMCCLAFVFRGWMEANIGMIFYHLFLLEEEEKNLHLNHIVNWSISEMEQVLYPFHCITVGAQIPSAILSMAFSPHKIMAISMGFTVLTHVIIPWAIGVSSTILIFLVLFQSIFSSPLDCACIGLLREWTPSTEKTSLILIAFSGQFVLHRVFPVSIYLSENVSPSSIYYFAGLAGIIWCLLWGCLISNSPANDPLITQSELLYLEEKIPAQNREQISMKSVPWRSILSSFPVLAFFIVFMSSSLSSNSMIYLLIFQIQASSDSVYSIQVMEWILTFNNFVIVPALGLLIDVLMKRGKINITVIRKVMCSSGLLLHAFFLLLVISIPSSSGAVFFMLSFILYPFSAVGFLPNMLDLSPRYACAIAGIAMTLRYGVSTGFYILVDYLGTHVINSIYYLWMVNYIPTLLVAVTAAIMFAVHGSGNEQIYTRRPSSTPTSGNDARYYPRSGSVEDVILSSDDL